MENFNVIEFHHTRDFSRKMNATFEFIRQNFKPLGKSILFIAGPPVLVASMMIGSFIGDFLNLTQTAATNPGDAENLQSYFMSVNFWLQITMVMTFFIISGVMTVATINNYLVLYEQKQSNRIEVGEVWEAVRSTFWMYFGTMFFFSLLAVVAYIILIIPVVLLASISPALIFFGVFFLIGGIFYLMVSVSLTFIVRAYENKGFFEAIGRSFSLVQGKWWSTFGLIMVLYLIMMTISYIFLIPWYAVTFISALHNTTTTTLQEPATGWEIVTIVLFTLYYLAQMVLATLPNIGIAFQYFNLVEMKEAKGLLNKINTLGQGQGTTAAPEEQF
jgi:hypothetical protein